MREFDGAFGFHDCDRPKVPAPGRPQFVEVEASWINDRPRAGRRPIGSLLFDERGRPALTDMDQFDRAVGAGFLPQDSRLSGFFARFMASLDSLDAVATCREYPVQVPYYPLVLSVTEPAPV